MGVEANLKLDLHQQSNTENDTLSGQFEVRTRDDLERLIAILTTFRPVFDARFSQAEAHPETTSEQEDGRHG